MKKSPPQPDQSNRRGWKEHNGKREKCRKKGFVQNSFVQKSGFDSKREKKCNGYR